MRQIADGFREDASDDERKDYTEGIESVLYIRCMAHRNIPQYNHSEINGAECAACRVEPLQRAADAAVEAIQVTHDWLGSASTRNAAEETWARLERRLRECGYDSRIPNELHWRGSLINALERAGFRCSGEQDNWDDIRQLSPGQPNYEYAKGRTLKEVAMREAQAQIDILALLSMIDPNELDEEDRAVCASIDSYWKL